jgi:hypothetical protein
VDVSDKVTNEHDVVRTVLTPYVSTQRHVRCKYGSYHNALESSSYFAFKIIFGKSLHNTEASEKPLLQADGKYEKVEYNEGEDLTGEFGRELCKDGLGIEGLTLILFEELLLLLVLFILLVLLLLLLILLLGGLCKDGLGIEGGDVGGEGGDELLPLSE